MATQPPKKVTPSVGPEQEYFLVDAEKFLQRKDLIFTGRTLFGAMPPKGQELDDHYFGTIRQRIASFMKDVNVGAVEAWRIRKDTAQRSGSGTARAGSDLCRGKRGSRPQPDCHGDLKESSMPATVLTCLLHEKPFAGVNGSGKHNNWSLTTDDGINLLDPGKTPHENIQFLLVLTCILKAVDDACRSAP